MIVYTGVFLFGILSQAFSLYSSNSDVIELNDSNFDKLVAKSDEIWIVEFFAPWCGHCQQFASEYSKAATALKGVAKVGAINADDHKSVAGRYGVRGFPTIKIVYQSKTEDYNGPRTAQGLADAVVNVIKKKINEKLGGGKSSGGSSDDVIELTDSNFDKLVLQSDDIWLVEFYAPWCGHCKNLAPHWAEAATKLKGKVKLGALDATAHQSKASEYNVQGYPTIKYFPPGKKTRSSAENYEGGRTSSDIVTFALDKLAENIEPPEIKQIVDENTLKTACEDHPLCVISVLPHILDCQADCRNGYLKILKEMGDKFKQKLWGWVWSEAGAQPDLEQALEIGGFGYPAMAVINAKKMKYSILRGSFSSDGINEFLRDLSYGRGSTGPVKGSSLPSVVATEAWDGKDGVPPQDEDIDLSDVRLDDEL